MQSLKFRQLLLLSSTNKLANQFTFSEEKNLITAIDNNSVGKSTIVKLLLWGVGCEPSLDSQWTSQDCKTIVEFSIGNNIYFVKRSKDFISIKKQNEKALSFSKITNGYSDIIAKLLKFRVLLPNRNTGLLEVPPPVYYFLPFYIDQKKSWANAWDNFDNLGQYDNWKNTVVKYHVGLLTPKHFELECQKREKQNIQNDVKRKIEKIDTALEVVDPYIQELTIATTNKDKFEELTTEIKVELKKLQSSQEELLSLYAQSQSEKTYLEHQKIISERIISELEKDYRFTIENLIDDKFECPLCGTIHDNSIVNRASILVDKNQSENQLNSIKEGLNKVNQKLAETRNQLQIMRNRISEINTKYTIKENDRTVNFEQIIESIAGSSIKRNVINDKNEKIIVCDSLNGEIKTIGKEIKKLNSKEMINNTNSYFIETLTNYIETLGANSVNLSKINSPLDYNRIIKEGGAAEGSRAILAYYLTIFTMVLKFGHEIKSPLIIDTPNQQEQSKSNYDKIVTLLSNDIPKNTQVFLCAMNNQHLDPFKKDAKIITLKEHKLLIPDRFQEIETFFSEF